MHAELAERWHALENRRIALVALVRSMSPERQAAKPASRGFSPVEVIEHFALVEEFDANYLRKTDPQQLSHLKPRPHLVYRVTVKNLRKPTNLPTMRAMTPRGPISIEEAVHRWESVRGEIGGFLCGVRDPNAAFIKMNALFGTLSAFQLLELFDAHHDYHESRLRAGG